MRSDNLNNHVNTRHGVSAVARKRIFDDSYNVAESKSYSGTTAVKRPTESLHKPRPKNPKIQTLLDEIIDDDPDRNVTPQVVHKGYSIVPPPVSTPEPNIIYSPVKVLPSQTSKKRPLSPDRMPLTKKSHPRTKEDTSLLNLK